MKTCTKCGIEKPLSAYYYDKHKADKKHPECKSCFNLRMKETRKMQAYKIVFNPYQKEWQRKYRQTAKHKAWRKESLIKRAIKGKELKQIVVNHYGGVCACCGISEICFLSIDHINNDGYKEKGHRKNRVSGYHLYQKIIRENYPDNLQIYCFNCNIAKQHNGGECPHKSNAIVCDNDERKG
jgi:hypothetical protein